jgi:hypothetical protein
MWVEFCRQAAPPVDPLLRSGERHRHEAAAAEFIMKRRESSLWDSDKVGVALARLKEAMAFRGGGYVEVWNCTLVRVARKACAPSMEELREKGRAKRSHARLAVTIEFVEWLRPQYWGDGLTGWDIKATVDRRMAYLAVAMGVDRLFRA